MYISSLIARGSLNKRVQKVSKKTPDHRHPLQTYQGSEFKNGFVFASHVPPKQFAQQSDSSTLLKSLMHVITVSWTVNDVLGVVVGEGGGGGST